MTTNDVIRSNAAAASVGRRSIGAVIGIHFGCGAMREVDPVSPVPAGFDRNGEQDGQADTDDEAAHHHNREARPHAAAISAAPAAAAAAPAATRFVLVDLDRAT